MQELARDIAEAATPAGDVGSLQQSAERWAQSALKTFRDPLLVPALKISASIVEFLAALDAVKEGSDE